MSGTSLFLTINNLGTVSSGEYPARIHNGTTLYNNGVCSSVLSFGGACPNAFGDDKDFYSGVSLPQVLNSTIPEIETIRIQGSITYADIEDMNSDMAKFKSGYVTDGDGVCHTFGMCATTTKGYFDIANPSQGVSFATLSRSLNSLPYKVYLDIGSPRFVFFGEGNGFSNMRYNSRPDIFNNTLEMSHGVSNQIYGIDYGNAKWVAAAIPTATGLGPEYHIMTSSTGISYAPSDSTGDTFNSGGRGVAYSNFERRWVAVGTNTGTGGNKLGNIMWSDNGSCWVAVTTGDSFDTLGHGVAYGGGTWVAVGKSGIKGGYDSIMYSTNGGVSWTKPTTGDSFPSGAEGLGVAYHEGHWVAVAGSASTTGGAEKIMWSTNGTCWVHSASNGASFSISGNAVAYGSDRWVAVGNNNVLGGGDPYGNILVSLDGKFWTKSGPDSVGGGDPGVCFSVEGKSLIYGDGLWVAGGDDGINGLGRLKFSLNGGNSWIDQSAGVCVPTSIRTVGYGLF